MKSALTRRSTRRPLLAFSCFPRGLIQLPSFDSRSTPGIKWCASTRAAPSDGTAPRYTSAAPWFTRTSSSATTASNGTSSLAHSRSVGFAKPQLSHSTHPKEEWLTKLKEKPQIGILKKCQGCPRIKVSGMSPVEHEGTNRIHPLQSE